MKKLLVVLALAAAWIVWRRSAPPPPSPRAPVHLVGPHEGRVSALLGGDIPLSGDVHGRIVRWTTPPDTWIAHDGAVRRILKVDDDWITVGGDGSVARWRAPGVVVWRRRHPEALNDAVWIDGALIVATTRGTVARLGPDGPVWQSRGAHGQAAFAVLAQGDAVLTTGTDGRIVERAVTDGAVRRVDAASKHWIAALAPGADGPLFVDGVGQLGRKRSGEYTTYAALSGPGISLAANATSIAAGGEKGEIAIFERAGGHQRVLLTAEPVLSLAWQGDRLLSGGGANGAVRIWRVNDGAEVGRLPPTTTAAPGEVP